MFTHMVLSRHIVLASLIAIVVLLPTAGTLRGDDPDPIVGVWWTPKKDAKVMIKVTDGVYSGRIIAGSGEERLDEKNPDPTLRTRKLLGIVLLKSFKPNGAGKASGGSIYDPDNGKTYTAKMWTDGTDKLMVRGFLGTSALGRTEKFERVAGPKPATQQSGEPEMVYAPNE